MSDEVISGFMQGKRWMWLAIILLVVIIFVAILNVSIKTDLTMPIAVMGIILGIVLLYFLLNRDKAKLIDLIRAEEIVTERINKKFPETWDVNPSRNEFHGTLFDELHFGIQCDEVAQVYVVDRRNGGSIVGMLSPDLNKARKQWVENEMLHSAISKDIKIDEIKKKLVEGTE